MNETVGLGHPPLMVRCEIIGSNIYWVINGELATGRTIGPLRERGISVSNTRFNEDNASAIVTVTISRGVNNTMFVCEAQTGSTLVTSAPATILIAG
jgi:hypothetical protein